MYNLQCIFTVLIVGHGREVEKNLEYKQGHDFVWGSDTETTLERSKE